jgi:hypothetical protein
MQELFPSMKTAINATILKEEIEWTLVGDDEASNEADVGEKKESIVVISEDFVDEDDDAKPAADTTAKSQVPPKHDPNVIGAGVVTGLCGFLLGGPLLAAALGISAGYAAENDTQGPLGKAARKVGDWAVQTEQKVETYDEQHHVSGKINSWLRSIWQSIQRTCACGEHSYGS